MAHDSCRLDSWEVVTPCCDIEGVDPDILAKARAAAIATLDRLTCHRYGVCRQQIFPCDNRCFKDCGTCLTCKGERIDLYPLAGHVLAIAQAFVGPVLVDPTTYQLTSHRYLYPFVGSDLYPIPKQHMNLPPGSEGTWSLWVDSGEEIPADVAFAVGDLMCQFIAKCQGAACDIPDNAISITREGITLRLETGLDAIASVKSVRQMYNCSKRRTGIFDPARFPAGKVPS